jgi:hypothetical protein
MTTEVCFFLQNCDQHGKDKDAAVRRQQEAAKNTSYQNGDILALCPRALRVPFNFGGLRGL